MSQSISSTAFAILKLDIVGYSIIVGVDEEEVIQFIDDTMADVRRILEQNGGTVRSKAGDSFLVTFTALRDALHSAFQIQERTDSKVDFDPVVFRIGVHIGDVFVSGEEVAGNAVNIAARLEALADPGGICVSWAVYDLAVAKLRRHRFERFGNVQLKNIDGPVEVFKSKRLMKASPVIRTNSPDQFLTVLDRPKILVRPFISLGDDLRSSCFAAGFTTDLISRLSRFRHLDVIGRASSYALESSTINNSAAVEVNARYIASGQFQIVGIRLRARVLLSDATTERILWAETYDRVLDDVFDVQAEVVDVVTAGMAVNIDLEEGKIARARDPANLERIRTLLRGRWRTWRPAQRDA